ncbi:MAG: hypothetical protein J0M30_04820 [Chitinophagales bacterium]|nr:hypothetical protein [Chitinophagales bacterium]
MPQRPTDSIHVYDIIIAGMGCAGLSLASRLVAQGKFSDKKILLIDRVSKTQNDRTWCFWEKGQGFFESIVHHQWPKTWVHGEGFSRCLDISPYTYKMIRGNDFYAYNLRILKGQSNFTIQQEEVVEVNPDGWVSTAGGNRYHAPLIFNSIPSPRPAASDKLIWMLQHFKGWVIKTQDPVFDPAEATLMDFRVDQSRGTCFVYVMPFDKHTALVEYTLFSSELLEDEEYDLGLDTYIRQHVTAGPFTITEKEFGIIPMTNYRFPAGEGAVISIGTSGGQTKGSSGYTFQFIQKQSRLLVDQLARHYDTAKSYQPVGQPPARFRFYDSVLLDVLRHQRMPGHQVFLQLFQKNKPAQVLKFLDNESTISEEASVILSLPVGPFLKAAIHQLF